MRARGALSAGLLLGLLAGLWDGVAILVENPRSFAGPDSAAAFLGATLALSLVVGAFAGLAATAARVPARAVLVAGLALWIFFWVGVRVHVRFFFGEPLTAPVPLLVNAAILVAAVLLALLAGQLARRATDALASSGAVPVAAGIVFVASAAVAFALAPRIRPPVATGTPPVNARDALLITLDTTRADHLSWAGYPRGTAPAIDRLRRRGWGTAYAVAPIPLTNPSHASMFTGLLPREHGVVNNGMALPDSIPTFIEDLARDGWSCAAFVSGIPLKASLSGLARGFTVYDDAFSPLERIHPVLTTMAIVRVANRILPLDFVERRADATADAAVRWLRTSSGPRFLWVHFFDPHTPYDAPGPLRERFAKESAGWTASGRPVTEWPIADYDAEIRATDAGVEAVLRAFEEVTRGRGVVILTADHGEGLGQHGELTHGTQLHAEDLTVPLIVGGAEPARGMRPWRLTVAPEACFLPDWIPTWGRAAAVPSPPLTPESERSVRLLMETFAPEGRHDQSAVLARGGDGRVRKLIRNHDTGEEIAFDLTGDPGETTPVDASGAEWDSLRAALPAREAGVGPELDPETVRRLRALGYIH